MYIYFTINQKFVDKIFIRKQNKQQLQGEAFDIFVTGFESLPRNKREFKNSIHPPKFRPEKVLRFRQCIVMFT